jgi:hypothetical protein
MQLTLPYIAAQAVQGNKAKADNMRQKNQRLTHFNSSWRDSDRERLSVISGSRVLRHLGSRADG